MLSKETRETLIHHIIVVLLAVGIMAFFTLIAIFAKPLEPVKRAIKDFSFTDIYYEILNDTGEPELCPYITIVDLTNLTNRTDIAHTMSEIMEAQPKVLGVDAVFDNIGEDFEGNDSLISVVEKYKNIMFSLKALDYKNDSIGHTKEIHSFFAEFVDITEGTTNMPRGMYDSMKRTVPMGEVINGKFHNSFCVQVCNMYGDKDFRKGRTNDIQINFSPTKFTRLNPEDVAKHPELIRDRIVLLGSLYEDADWHWTPASKIPGVELLAYGINNIIHDKEVVQVPQTLFVILSLLIVLLVQYMQAKYLSKTSASKNMFVKFVIGSTYIMGMITFLFTSVFIGISFLVFMLTNISFNLAWAISLIAFLGTSRSMYDAIKNYVRTFGEKHAWVNKIFV